MATFYSCHTILTLLVAVAAVPSVKDTGSLVTWTVRCSFSMRGHAPCTRHVWKSPENVRRWGSPNNPQCLCWVVCLYVHSSSGGRTGSNSPVYTGPLDVQLCSFICFWTTFLMLWNLMFPLQPYSASRQPMYVRYPTHCMSFSVVYEWRWFSVAVATW